VSSTAGAPVGPVGPVGDDEDFDEPEIPEYLIAEQRRGRQQQQQQGRGGPRGGRGARSAYTAAIERERYGTGGRSGGINRYPDVSGRDRQSGGQGGGRQGGGGGRDAGYPRHDRPERVERPARTGGDPWSEVPPELEEMLRAQLAQSGKARPSSADERVGRARRDSPTRRGRDAAAADDAAEAAPKRTTTRRTTTSAARLRMPPLRPARPPRPRREAATTRKTAATAAASRRPQMPGPEAAGDHPQDGGARPRRDGEAAAARRSRGRHRKKAEPA
jgi:hypothetical protein